MSFYRFMMGLIVSGFFCINSVFASCSSCYVPREGGSAQGSEITSGPMIAEPTASTIGKGRAAAGFTLTQLKFNTIPAANAHQFHHLGNDVHGKNREETYDIHAGYGVTDNWDVYLSAPVVSKTVIEIDSHRYLGQRERSTGFGDMRFITKYRFWKRFFEAALIGAVKFPTGNTSDKTPYGKKFAPENQPGTGSWDGEFGIALSRSFLKHWSVATSFQYAMRTRGAQQFHAGDLFVYNAGISYAIKELGTNPNLSVVLELKNAWGMRDRSREEERILASGGTTILVSPGLVADLNRHVSAFWAMPLPVYQNLGGEHEELRYEIVTGMNFRF